MNRRLRVGLIGSGMVAQIMHLPHLAELDDLYEVRALCDASPTVLEHCGRAYGVPLLFTDWADLLNEELDAVLVLTSGSHGAPAVAAAESGLHLFVEKPLCYSSAEGIRMLESAERTGVVLMAGYPKRYDPAYLRAREVVGGFGDLRFAQVTTLESPYQPYVTQYRCVRGADVPPERIEQRRKAHDELLDEAIGPERDGARGVYEGVLLDTMVHEFNLLRGILGEPSALGFARLQTSQVTVALEFGAVGCTVTWLDLPGIADYQMEARFFDPEGRVRLVFPSPYLKNTPSLLEITSGVSGTSQARVSREVISYGTPFRQELLAFHAAVTDGVVPPTSGMDALRDVALCESVVASARSGARVDMPSGPVGWKESVHG